MAPEEKIRCPWCLSFEAYIRYHDEEWGVPVHEDRKHFEFLILEGAQAGLSWSTILKKRDAYKTSTIGGIRANPPALLVPGYSRAADAPVAELQNPAKLLIM